MRPLINYFFFNFQQHHVRLREPWTNSLRVILEEICKVTYVQIILYKYLILIDYLFC
jgi:hypothetical protein